MSRWFAMVPGEGQAIAGDLGLHALRVYIAICRFSDRDGHSRCSQPDISQVARIKDKRHISRALARLIEAKLIERTRCRSNTGGHAANSYRVIHIAAQALTPVEAGGVAPAEAGQTDTKKTINQNDDGKGRVL
jgi:hypothetical protein